MPNLYALHHDPKYWKNPNEFRPERWYAGMRSMRISMHLNENKLKNSYAGMRSMRISMHVNELLDGTTM